MIVGLNLDDHSDIINSKYYNTTSITGEVLAKARKDARSLDQRILDVFKKYSSRPLSATDIQLVFIREKTDVINQVDCKKMRRSDLVSIKSILGSTDSIKRSLNTLCKESKLIKVVGDSLSSFGASEYTYKLI